MISYFISPVYLIMSKRLFEVVNRSITNKSVLDPVSELHLILGVYQILRDYGSVSRSPYD